MTQQKVSLERTSPTARKDWASMTIKQMAAHFKQMLTQDETWCCRAILAIYENQTAEEKAHGTTIKHNGIGFSGTDATLLSSFALQLQRGKNLSRKQMLWAHKLMPKYAGQLAKMVYLTQEAEPIPPTEVQEQEIFAEHAKTEMDIMEEIADMHQQVEMDGVRLLTCYYRDIDWDNTHLQATSYEETLHIDKLGWPDLISVIAPSGLSHAVFSPSKWNYDHDPDGPNPMFIAGCEYKGTIEGRVWSLVVFAGARPGPDWSLYPEGTREMFEGA